MFKMFFFSDSKASNKIKKLNGEDSQRTAAFYSENHIVKRNTRASVKEMDAKQN